METGLSPDTSYYRYAQVYNLSGTGSSNSDLKYTFANPPANLQVTQIGSDWVDLTWDENSNPQDTKYGVSYSTVSSFAVGVSTPYYDLVTNTATVGSLSPDTTYWFRAWAYNGGGAATGFSAPASTKTLSLPDAPSDLVGLVLSTTSIKWDWQDNSDDEQGFRIYSSTGGSPLWSGGIDVSSWTETGLTANAAYSRYVAAYNAGGETQSDTTTYCTLANIPAALTVSAVTEHTISLGWSGDGTTYDVERSTDGVFWSTAPVANVSTTSFTDTYLHVDMSYWHRIKACNSYGIINSTPSNVVSTTTLTVEVILANSSSTVVGVDDDTKLEVRIAVLSGTFGKDVYIRIKEPEDTPELTAANDKDELDLEIDRIVGTDIQVDAVDLEGHVLLSADFKEKLEITLSYSDEESGGGNGLVDGTSPSVDETTLGMYVLDESQEAWSELTDGHDSDYTLNEISVLVEHLSVFIIMGEPMELEKIVAYPNPWKTDSGVSDITFIELPDECEIRIYNVAGELIRTMIEPEEGGVNDREHTWDLTNEFAKPVAQGVYLYLVIETDQGELTGRKVVGKLALIRGEP
jgi:hypothetical protein